MKTIRFNELKHNEAKLCLGQAHTFVSVCLKFNVKRKKLQYTHGICV